MQSLTWYIRRLRAMTLSEVAWRARSSIRDAVDRHILGPGFHVRVAQRAADRHPRTIQPGFRVCDLPVGFWRDAPSDPREAAWRDALLRRAGRVCDHRLKLFDLADCDVGSPIRWNHEHKAGIDTPMTPAYTIDYRDHRVTGDCKFVWEPNRCQHLVVLGRAYRATGDARFAAEAARQIESWIDACPFGHGMNWRSPLELGIRLINWTWTLDLISEAGVVDERLTRRIVSSVYLHLLEITRKYSYGSSANNHLIGEAAGVYVATRYFRALDRAASWAAEARRTLEQEILRQTYDDGVNREQALGYHLFSMQFFLIAALVGRKVGDSFSNTYSTTLARMLDFVDALSQGADVLPMYGDADDGIVLDLADDPLAAHPWLAAGATLLADEGPRPADGHAAESVLWLMGQNAAPRCAGSAAERREAHTLASRAFPSAGIYLLQAGRADSPERVSVSLDCGELGFGPIAAHGHADALSVTLRAFGGDVLVDPGTFDYFTYPEWRAYFRSTRAHNTVEIDGLDQSETLGLFLWGARATAHCIEWRPSDSGGTVVAEHDGYGRLKDPLRHIRFVTLDGDSRTLTIVDELITQGHHRAVLHFHLAESCTVTELEDGQARIDTGRGIVEMSFDPRLTVAALRGSTDPIAGWVSRGYHRRSPATTLSASCEMAQTVRLVTRVEIGVPAGLARAGARRAAAAAAR
ncbi:MAG: hypothetical protein CHACPFDD_03829 [Phycisphaerae bacterium]|nr:hypothetical protein [Phycisphaerae bacterium]